MPPPSLISTILNAPGDPAADQGGPFPDERAAFSAVSFLGSTPSIHLRTPDPLKRASNPTESRTGRAAGVPLAPLAPQHSRAYMCGA